MVTVVGVERCNAIESRNRSSFEIWRLPDVLVYHIASFMASPTHRAYVVCQQCAILNRASRSLLQSPALWESVLHGDYLSFGSFEGCEQKLQLDSSELLKGPPRKGHKLLVKTPPKCRTSRRLRRTPIERVRDAHQLMLNNTEIAYSYLWDLCYANKTTPIRRNRTNNSRHAVGGITKAKLVRILNEYGPCLRFDHVMATGGTFLVEICRARNTTKSTILACVKELVARATSLYSSSPLPVIQLQTNESSNSKLTALCVASVRAMPQVVRFLLSCGAPDNTVCSGRFRLDTQPKQSVRGLNLTALQFAQLMYQAELDAGANEQSLSDLRQCIDILKRRQKLSS